jgi:hypothetical protein
MNISIEDYYFFIKIDPEYEDKSGLFEILELYFYDFCERIPEFDKNVKYSYLNAVKLHNFAYYKDDKIISSLVFSSTDFNDAVISRFDTIDMGRRDFSTYTIKDLDVDDIYKILEFWINECIQNSKI